MPGTIRPDKKMAKLIYKILKTPKDLQQKNEYKPDRKRSKTWFVDSSVSQ